MFNANRFNAAIALKGETQKDAAKIMGMNQTTLYRKIIGESDFFRKEIELFCSHYEVSPNEIFFAQNSA